ncbi:MAG: DEAD/DEAH box helicase [Planctomycetaceae bacterium]
MNRPPGGDVELLGALIADAVEGLISKHDRGLDKRASQLRVKAPTLDRDNEALCFVFKNKGARDEAVDYQIRLRAERDGSSRGARRGSDLSFVAEAECVCPTFKDQGFCHHTLASAWWLQEQLGRQSDGGTEDFFASLTVDPTLLGKAVVDRLLMMTDESPHRPTDRVGSRIQWRIRLNSNRYYQLVSVVPYEQKPRKSGVGWTKGRELRGYDLENRPELFHTPIDAKVMSLVSMSGSTYGKTDYASYEAMRQLVGHPNVAWDDGEATPIEVLRGELTLSIDRLEDASDTTKPGMPSEDDESNPWDKLSLVNKLMATKYRPRLVIPDVNCKLKSDDVEIQLGYSSPLNAMLIFAAHAQRKLVLCDLRDVRSAPMFEYLLTENLEDVVLDAASAAKLAAACVKLNEFLSVRLPDELSGPIENAMSTVVVELRPRAAAGLSVAIRVDEPRFPTSQIPGSEPRIVRCLTQEGPVRLERDLDWEASRAADIVSRYGFHGLQVDGPLSWIATTDETALDLLGRLYEPSDDAPPILWPEGQTMRVRGEITPASLRVKLDDRRDWFGLSGFVELEGKQVLLSDLLVAVRENRSLVRVGDREFAQISEAFRRRLQQLGDAVVAERGALRIADAAASVVSDLLGDDVCLEASARWQQTLSRLDAIRHWVPETPVELQATLRHYQEEGYQWLARLSRWGVGGILADDMGLGKTVQALGVLLDRGADGPALVVAPTSVGDNWMRETARFAPPLRARLYREHDRQHLIDSAQPNDLVIVSYQLLQRDAERFASRQWNTLVLDEAQFIKNAQTKTAQAIRNLDANWRIGLSGTPLENHLGELWSLFRTLSPGLLGSWERFRSRFAEPIERHKDDDRRESLARLVRPFILRRTKANVLTELPPRTEVTLFAEMSGLERKRYEDARVAAIAELSGTSSLDRGEGDQRMRTLAWLTKLRQLACHPRMIDKSWRAGSAKLSLFLETVDELRDGEHRALVFSQFVKHLEVVREALDERGITYQYLDGSTPAAERQRRVDAFQNGEGDLFLISLKAGGTGLNLTAANYVLHLDPWWNPAVEDQATDRAHRIGQERAVTVYRLVAKGTIEEQILELHANKRELVASVLSGTDQAGRLSTDEMIDLIRAGS